MSLASMRLDALARRMARELDAEIMAMKPSTLKDQHALAVADLRRLIALLETRQFEQARDFALALRSIWRPQ